MLRLIFPFRHVRLNLPAWCRLRGFIVTSRGQKSGQNKVRLILLTPRVGQSKSRFRGRRGPKLFRLTVLTGLLESSVGMTRFRTIVGRWSREIVKKVVIRVGLWGVFRRALLTTRI